MAGAEVEILPKAALLWLAAAAVLAAIQGMVVLVAGVVIAKLPHLLVIRGLEVVLAAVVAAGI
jgi:hypothetical protein